MLLYCVRLCVAVTCSGHYIFDHWDDKEGREGQSHPQAREHVVLRWVACCAACGGGVGGVAGGAVIGRCQRAVAKVGCCLELCTPTWNTGTTHCAPCARVALHRSAGCTHRRRTDGSGRGRCWFPKCFTPPSLLLTLVTEHVQLRHARGCGSYLPACMYKTNPLPYSSSPRQQNALC